MINTGDIKHLNIVLFLGQSAHICAVVLAGDGRDGVLLPALQDGAGPLLQGRPPLGPRLLPRLVHPAGRQGNESQVYF